MFDATIIDKEVVVDILVESFKGNKSVERVSGGDAAKTKALMEYCFIKCILSGKVYISYDKQGCALILYPNEKRNYLKLFWNDLKFIIKVVGLKNLKQVLADQSLINQTITPQSFHVWYMAVHPSAQHKGLGTYIIKKLLKEAHIKERALILETSSEQNVEWYSKFGIKEYAKLDFGYPLYFLST